MESPDSVLFVGLQSIVSKKAINAVTFDLDNLFWYFKTHFEVGLYTLYLSEKLYFFIHVFGKDMGFSFIITSAIIGPLSASCLLAITVS